MMSGSERGTGIGTDPGHPPLDTPPDSNPGSPTERSRWSRIAEVLLALGVVALGVVVLVETQDIRVTRAMARVGPRVIPTIVGSGLIVIGIWYAVDVLRRSGDPVETDSEDVDPTLPADWSTIAGIGAALVVYLLTIERLGFIIASALLFIITAIRMGSRAYLGDVAIGILIAVAVYVAFSTGLGVRLPEGVLDGLL